MLVLMFSEIVKSTKKVGNWRVILVPVEKIGHTLVVITADHQSMASTALIIKEGEYIDVHLSVIFVETNIVG